MAGMKDQNLFNLRHELIVWIDSINCSTVIGQLCLITGFPPMSNGPITGRCASWKKGGGARPPPCLIRLSLAPSP